MQGNLDFKLLFRYFNGRILLTWFMVLLENFLWALVPYFMGRTIDALLNKQSSEIWVVAFLMLALTLTAVLRRFLDTRSYGTMRVKLGMELVKRMGDDRSVSQINARLDMSRELVDFLEEHIPELITAIVQIVVSIVILWSMGNQFGINAVIVMILLVVIYVFFHRRFLKFNEQLNTQMEKQVTTLDQRNKKRTFTHLMRLRQHEIKLSDADAILYGFIFLIMFGFVLVNLWYAATIPAITAGTIFIILSYSWEFVDSGFGLPIVLQQWSRLEEIRQRLNEKI